MIVWPSPEPIVRPVLGDVARLSKLIGWKIVAVDNFDRDYVDDILICENIHDRDKGELMLNALQSKFGGVDSKYFYKLVPQSYVLNVFHP